MSDKAKKWVKISLTVLSVVLPLGYMSLVLFAEAGPITDTQERLAGAMITKAILFAAFANLAIWGWGKPSAPKR